MDEPGHEVGEGFSDPGARLEQQRHIGGHGGGYGARHLLLLGPVLEREGDAYGATVNLATESASVVTAPSASP